MCYYRRILTLLRMGLLEAAHGWGEPKKPPLPKICHKYPTMMKLLTLIPYLKKMQKIKKSGDTLLQFCWHQHFWLEISNFCCVKKYRCRFFFWYIISNSFDFFLVLKVFFNKHEYNFDDVSKNGYFSNKSYDAMILFMTSSTKVYHRTQILL